MTVSAATVGDPEAMRAFARQLMSRADLLRGAQQGPASRLDGATFEGPAATRLRAAAGDLTTRLQGICAGLDATAQALLGDATVVEQQNAELRAAAERAAEKEAAEQKADKAASAVPSEAEAAPGPEASPAP